jgi:hypothetical protein
MRGIGPKRGQGRPVMAARATLILGTGSGYGRVIFFIVTQVQRCACEVVMRVMRLSSEIPRPSSRETATPPCWASAGANEAPGTVCRELSRKVQICG